MEHSARQVLYAIAEAQDAVESNRPLRVAAVNRLLNELIRTRRLLAASERRLEKARRESDDRVALDGDGGAQGTASGEGEHLGRQGSHVDPERG